MAGDPPSPSLEPPPRIGVVQVAVPLAPGAPPTPVIVPAESHDEAVRLLGDLGQGLPAGVAWGRVLGGIRDGYNRQLAGVELSIMQRRAELGPNPTEYELRGLAQWGARRRTSTARLWRIPAPLTGAGLEARDWRVYGRGGRTFDNVLARNARAGRTGVAAYEHMIGSATRSNPEFNASVAQGAKLLRGPGGVLAVAGLAITAHDIWTAPPGRRLQVAEHAGVSFAGGLVGSEVACGLLTIGAGLLLATPPGWVVVAVGLVGGVVGSMIADHVFYPDDYRPVAERMRAGVAVDPRRLAGRATVPGGTASTDLPIIRQVVLDVLRGDTPASLSRRASMQAAASVGLSPAEQQAFADRNGGTPSWLSGDPTPQDGPEVRGADVALTAGRRIVFRLSPEQRDQLAWASAQ